MSGNESFMKTFDNFPFRRKARSGAFPAREGKGGGRNHREKEEEHVSAWPALTGWLKIKARSQQEFVVGSTEGKGSRKHLGALLLGAYRNGKLRYFGHSGAGLRDKGISETIERLKPPFITD